MFCHKLLGLLAKTYCFWWFHYTVAYVCKLCHVFSYISSHLIPSYLPSFEKGSSFSVLIEAKAYFIKGILEKGKSGWRETTPWVYKQRNQSHLLIAWERLITKQNTTFDEVFLKVCVGALLRWTQSILNENALGCRAELSWTLLGING